MWIEAAPLKSPACLLKVLGVKGLAVLESHIVARGILRAPIIAIVRKRAVAGSKSQQRPLATVRGCREHPLTRNDACTRRVLANDETKNQRSWDPLGCATKASVAAIAILAMPAGLQVGTDGTRTHCYEAAAP
jgi:type IV pilus biogenesis protein CpaD/CtpE